MLATIQRWGNSQGIRIPKNLLKDLGMAAGDRVELTPCEDGFMVRKAAPNKRQTLREIYESFYEKPFEEIPRASAPEVDWGSPVGDEVW